MKKLLMVVLIAGVADVSAQGLLPRRTLSSRLVRPLAAVTQRQRLQVVTTNGVEWTYEVVDGGVFLGSGDRWTQSGAVPKLAVSQNTPGTLIIPETLAGMPVCGIGAGAFSCCSNLTSVTVPRCVKSIESDAFSGCSGLESVTIPCARSIGRNAFSGCTGLKSVTTPTLQGFSDCTNLTSVKMVDGEKSINGCFSRFINLTSVTIPSSVTELGWCAFLDCNRLTSVEIPASVAKIWWRGAFRGCSGLSAIVVAEGNDSYCSFDGVLYNKAKTELLLCPRGKVGSVLIPLSVTNIVSDAFRGCSGLKQFTVEEGNRRYASVDGVLYTKDMKKLVRCPGGLTSVMIPTGVTSIGYDAFSDCRGLRSIIAISEQPDSYGGSLLDKAKRFLRRCYRQARRVTMRCRGEKKGVVTIPPSVTDISIGAFSGCSGLVSVVIPSSVKRIGVRAFEDCKSMTSVMMSSSETAIERFAFRGCGGLADSNGFIVVKGVLCHYCGESSLVTIPPNVTSIGEYAFCNCTNLTAVTIPPSVTEIGRSAFEECTGLTSVIIPDGVTIIQGESFRGCSNLVSVTIPPSVTNVWAWAFCGCSGLKSVVIPLSVKSIGPDAFRHCHGLTSVTLPEGLTSVEEDAFNDCSGLMSVTIPPHVTNIGSSAFEGCRGLASVTIPPSVTNVERQAFSGCTNLASVTISSGVTCIGQHAFSRCYRLTSVTIPPSMTSVGSDAFHGCNGLKEVMIPTSLTNVMMSVRGQGKFQTVTSSMTLDDAVKSVFGRVGELLPPTNGMTTVVFEETVAVKENAGVRGSRSTSRSGISSGGTLRTRRLQRQQEVKVTAAKQREEQKAKAAERQAQAERENRQRETEKAERLQELLQIREKLKGVREAKARTDAENAKK